MKKALGKNRKKTGRYRSPPRVYITAEIKFDTESVDAALAILNEVYVNEPRFRYMDVKKVMIEDDHIYGGETV